LNRVINIISDYFLDHVITSLNLSGDKVKELTSITIPLLEKERIRIQNCIATISCEDAPQNECVRGELVSTDQLRILGNEAYRENQLCSMLHVSSLKNTSV
jgi:hypothetical protein